MLEELNSSFTIGPSTIGTLQEIKTKRLNNIKSFQQASTFQESIRSKVSSQALTTHVNSKQNLEKLENIYYIGTLFKSFFEFLDKVDLDSIGQLPNLVSNIISSNQTYKIQFTEVIKTRLEQWKQKYDDKNLPALLIAFEKSGLPLKKDNRELNIDGSDRKLFSQYLKAETKLKETYNIIHATFHSTFFERLLQKTQEAIKYHFLERGSELNKLQQPSWMFKYIGQIVDSNIKFALRILDLDRQTCSFIAQSFIEIVAERNIIERLKADVPKIGEDYELIFNFVDGVLALQHEIRSRFQSVANFKEGSLLEKLFTSFQQDQLLDKLLTYEANCFESKIFRDFFYINYSKINLKNLEAFNITQNFNLMLDKLYAKYLGCSPATKAKVNLAYGEIIDSMAKHLVTCFDRVYSNNDEKYEILSIFRRIEDEFHSHIQKYKAAIPGTQKSIQRLHAEMQKQFLKLADESLMPLNKKISKAVIDCPLTDGKLTSSELDLAEFMDFYKSWKAAMDKLNQIYFYKDNALVRVFFLFLKQIEFKKDGLMALIEAFEPFLRDIYTPEQYRLLKSLFFMENFKKAEILSQRSCLARSFLTQQEIGTITRLDYSL